jgi:3-hydroxyisobutyrate dehydrogenase
VTDPGETRMAVGIVGVGAMGGAMAECLLGKGWPVVVRDIVPGRADALGSRGAAVAASAAEVARRCDVVLTVVVDADQTDAVVFGEGGDAGVIGDARPDATIVMCSTVAPRYVAHLAERVVRHGVRLVDAPISGGPARARDGTLAMMAAAPDVAFAAAKPVLDAVASRLFRVGERCGDGSAMKIVNNMLAAIHLAAGAEAMALAERLGIDPRLVCDVVHASSGASWMLADRMPRALARDYVPPRAATRILAKDIGLALDVAREAAVPATLAQAAQALYAGAINNGWGDADDASLVEYCRSRKRQAPDSTTTRTTG